MAALVRHTQPPITVNAQFLTLPPLTDAGKHGANFIEIVSLSFDSLLANRVRSLLTMLGVIIGVASVVALIALGDGATASITGQVRALGTNVLTIAPGSPNNRGPGSSVGMGQLNMRDADAIAALNLPLAGMARDFSGSAPIVAPAADKEATVLGTTSGYASLNSLTIATGSFLTDDQVRSATQVVVLGSKLAEVLFGKGEAVGQTVRVKDQTLRVVGVLAPKGGGAFGSVDDRALVPITVAQQRLFGARTADGNDYMVSSVTLSASRSEDLGAIKSRVTALLRDRHNRAADGSQDDFQILDQSSFLGTLTTITSLLTAFVASIAGISLLVGGVGIMNIMLVSVTERTREIGLRKAVGATGSDILLQFVFEALVVSLGGGALGLLLGAGVAGAVTLSGLITATVSPFSVALAVGFSTAVGLFFGIYPAQRAARLNPIDALRHE